MRCQLQTEVRTPRRAIHPTQEVHAHGYIRAHVHPKRFPAVYQVWVCIAALELATRVMHLPSEGPAYGVWWITQVTDWRARLLAVEPHYVVVDKPWGVQVWPCVLCSSSARAEVFLVQ
jgi:hypothetical protein